MPKQLSVEEENYFIANSGLKCPKCHSNFIHIGSIQDDRSGGHYFNCSCKCGIFLQARISIEIVAAFVRVDTSLSPMELLSSQVKNEEKLE